jgi:hypothetical protein
LELSPIGDLENEAYIFLYFTRYVDNLVDDKVWESSDASNLRYPLSGIKRNGYGLVRLLDTNGCQKCSTESGHTDKLKL